MVDEERGAVRAVAWSEILPWLNLFRTFRLAIGFRALLLSAAAILLTTFGWWVLERVFSPMPTEQLTGRVSCPWTALAGQVPDRPCPLPGLDMEGGQGKPMGRESVGCILGGQDPFLGSWGLFTQPILRLFQARPSFTGFVYLLTCGLWGVAVWAFFGAAITRMAAVQLACEERLSWTAVMGHAVRKWPAYFGAPLFPLLGALLAAVPLAVLGVLMRIGIGTLLVGLIWPVLLVSGLLMALLLLGLIFGWPLMWATISSEGTDSFDALSRSYAYVFQRPLHYLFYAAVATLLGILGWVLVFCFAAGVIHLTYWAAGWGAGATRIAQISTGDPSLGSLGGAGATVIHFWTGCVRVLAVGFLYSYFWTAVTAIYFLLRRDVDATEMDEVYLEEEEPSYGLPPLKTDEAGVPGVDQPPAAPAGDAGKTPDEE